ncbi:hypothetical protein HPG69_013454, partial [Diceros bicornis minor]
MTWALRPPGVASSFSTVNSYFSPVPSHLQGIQMAVTRQAGSSVAIPCDIKQSRDYIHWYRYQEGMAPQRLLYYEFSSSKFVVDSGFSSGKYQAYKSSGRTCTFLLQNLEESDS